MHSSYGNNHLLRDTPEETQQKSWACTPDRPASTPVTRGIRKKSLFTYLGSVLSRTQTNWLK
jgi:hypothetical protein